MVASRSSTSTLRVWARRSLMIGTYGLMWVLIMGLAPALGLLALVHDLVRRNRWSGLRFLATIWVFLLSELVGVTVATLLWLRHQLSPGRTEEQWLDEHYRLQDLWNRALLHSAGRLLKLHFVVTGDELVSPGPIVVMIRHVSTLDTLLPVVFLGRRHGMNLRFVLKKELLIDPCLDIVGNRLPNCFVDRAGDTEREVVAVARLTEGLGPRDGVVIYPEGTRFSAGKLARALARLKDQHSSLHAIARQYQHVLPPRLGGSGVLLEFCQASGADVVFCAHTGLEAFTRLHDMLTGVLIDTTIRVHCWRVPARSIPSEPQARICWLFEQWVKVDNACHLDKQQSTAIEAQM